MTTFGARMYGAVQHVITRAGGVSACGRMVLPGKGMGAHVCKTCARINDDARKLSDTLRKAARDARIVMGVEAPTTEYESWSFDLSADEFHATMEKVNKINARCAAKGIPGGLRVESDHVERTYTDAWGFITKRWVYETKITGIPPQIPGWRFIATLDYDRNAGLITRCYPDFKGSIDRSLLREGWCDHCQTTRPRNRTYVVQSTTTGEQIQVGTSCIKDFTGWTALPVEFGGKVQEWAGSYGNGVKDWDTETVLGIAWACVQAHGFVRSNDIGSTKGLILNVLYPPTGPRMEEYRRELESLKQYAAVAMSEKAAELRAWILSDEFSGNGEYVQNLKAVAGGRAVSPHNIGLLASAPQAWARFQERTLIRKQESGPVSEWQGEVKSALTITATVEAIRYIDSDWGVTTLYKLRDEAGNLYEWFASNDTLGDAEEAVWTLTGTVKAHKEWKGHKTTQLTRVRKATQVR